MTAATLISTRHRVEDALEAIEFCYRQGWTDGLPVAPPTPDQVERFIEHSGRQADELVGSLPDRNLHLTVEKVAINAVMAGCLPAYMPVLLAAVEALTDDRFNAHASMASTAGAAPLMIVNGPTAREIGINAGDNLFGPGVRANATLGRALRLVLMNLCRAQPGVMDKATLGHPGKYSYCIGELEQDPPQAGWPPLHVQRGVPPAVGAVTLFAAEAPHYVKNEHAAEPEALLAPVVNALTHTSVSSGGSFLLVLCPQHQEVCLDHQWSKEDIQSYVFDKAHRSLASLKRHGWLAGLPKDGDDERFHTWLKQPSDLMVVVAGGRTSATSAIVPPWMAGAASRPVTKTIGVCIDCD